MTGLARALWAGCWQQWSRLPPVTIGLVTVVPLISVPVGAVFGYVARQRGDVRTVLYVAFGLLLWAIWSRGVIWAGFSLADEISAGTLEVTLLSRSSLLTVMAGKAMSSIAYDLAMGVPGAATVLVVGGARPALPGGLLTAAAAAVALLAVLATMLALAPLFVLTGTRTGTLNGLVSLGLVLNGLLAPVSSLPAALRVPADVLPAAWATQATWSSMNGAGAGQVAADLAVAVAEAAIWVGATVLASRWVERLLRARGTVSLV